MARRIGMRTMIGPSGTWQRPIGTTIFDPRPMAQTAPADDPPRVPIVVLPGPVATPPPPPRPIIIDDGDDKSGWGYFGRQAPSRHPMIPTRTTTPMPGPTIYRPSMPYGYFGDPDDDVDGGDDQGSAGSVVKDILDAAAAVPNITSATLATTKTGGAVRGGVFAESGLLPGGDPKQTKVFFGIKGDFATADDSDDEPSMRFGPRSTIYRPDPRDILGKKLDGFGAMGEDGKTSFVHKAMLGVGVGVALVAMFNLGAKK